MTRVEIAVDFNNLDDWLAFRLENHGLLQPLQFDLWGHEILASGCFEPLSEQFIPGDQLQYHNSWREGLSYQGVNSRVRAVMLVIKSIIDQNRLSSPSIYAAECLTPFALRLRGQFPRFLGSEFTLDPEKKRWMYPIPCEDLQNLTLPSDAFDIVSTNEVLEHVPSIDKSLSEICRVLKPGGWHIGTVPFRFLDQNSIVKAKLGYCGEVVHILEPEYHGDPMNEGGVLVFEIPGWDIIDRAKAAGFRRAFMRFIVSSHHGVLAEHIGGVFVLCCEK